MNSSEGNEGNILIKQCCTEEATMARQLASLGRRIHWRPVAAIVLAAILIGLPSLLYPFSRDQGEYAYIASAALDGKVIYRDIFNVKPPLTHMIHELALIAFGRSMVAIRLFDLLWQCATALVILAIANRMPLRRGAGVLAAGLYLLWYYSGSYWTTAQTDGFLILPAALGVWAFLIAYRRGWGWAFFSCGAALGVAVLFKYPIGILVPLLALPVLLRRDPRRLRQVALLGAGLATPLLICTVALAWEGSLRDFIYIQANYIPGYASDRHGPLEYLTGMLGSLFAFRSHIFTLWLSAVALLLELVHSMAKGIRYHTWPIALWWLAAVTSFVVQNKPYAYLALPLLAPTSLIMAELILMARDRVAVSWPLRLVAIGLTGLFGLIILVSYLVWGSNHDYRSFIEVIGGRKPLEAVYDNPDFGIFGAGGADGYASYVELKVARYIQSRTAPDETIFIWGFEPTIYFLSQRACASRFIYNYPLYGRFPWVQFQKEFLAEIESNAPRYIVVVRHDYMPWITGINEDSQTALARVDGLVELLKAHYQLEMAIGDLTLYRRR